MFFAGVGQVPIDRSSGRAAKEAMETGMRILRAGKILGISPRAPIARTAGCSGARPGSRDGARDRSDGVPVAMRRHPRDAAVGKIPDRGSEVRFGPALTSPRYEGLAGDRFVERR